VNDKKDINFVSNKVEAAEECEQCGHAFCMARLDKFTFEPNDEIL
jgi:hypothetical protein